MKIFFIVSYVLMTVVVIFTFYTNFNNEKKYSLVINEKNNEIKNQKKIAANFYSALKINEKSIHNLILSNDSVRYIHLKDLKRSPFHGKLIVCFRPNDCSVCLKELSSKISKYNLQNQIILLTTNKNYKMAKFYSTNENIKADVYESSIIDINELIDGNSTGPFIFLISNDYKIRKMINIYNLPDSMLDNYFENIKQLLSITN